MKFDRTNLLLIAALAAQIGLTAVLRDVRESRDILPPAPGSAELGLRAFGDNQFLYRQLALALQNFGDTGGRITPLKNYDMPEVVRWLDALDTLDLTGQHHMVLGARYFAQTQDRTQLIHLIRFIQRHVEKAPRTEVPWMMDAIYLASATKNIPVTRDLADQLGAYDFPEMTVLAYQLPAVLYEQVGEPQKAVASMERALRLTAAKASEDEKTFMREYIAGLSATR